MIDPWLNFAAENKPCLEPKVNLLDRWSGEDEDDDVKDNWDDDDDDEDVDKNGEQQQQKPAAQSKKKKNIKDKRQKEEEEEEVESRPRTEAEILADKLEKQRLQEESDLRLAKEAFGDNDSKQTPGLDIRLSSKNDFENFKKSLVDKLSTVCQSPHYVTFLENTFRELCLNLEPDDIKRLSSNLNALFNEKVKAQKVLIDVCI